MMDEDIRSGRSVASARSAGRTFRLWLCATFLFPACERMPLRRDNSERETRQFIAVMTELRRAHHSTGSQTEFAQKRTEILARHGTTEPELAAFIRAHGGDAARMSAIWDSVSNRLERTRPDGEAPADSLAPRTPS